MLVLRCKQLIIGRILHCWRSDFLSWLNASRVLSRLLLYVATLAGIRLTFANLAFSLTTHFREWILSSLSLFGTFSFCSHFAQREDRHPSEASKHPQVINVAIFPGSGAEFKHSLYSLNPYSANPKHTKSSHVTVVNNLNCKILLDKLYVTFLWYFLLNFCFCLYVFE